VLGSDQVEPRCIVTRGRTSDHRRRQLDRRRSSR